MLVWLHVNPGRLEHDMEAPTRESAASIGSKIDDAAATGQQGEPTLTR